MLYTVLYTVFYIAHFMYYTLCTVTREVVSSVMYCVIHSASSVLYTVHFHKGADTNCVGCMLCLLQGRATA